MFFSGELRQLQIIRSSFCWIPRWDALDVIFRGWDQ